MNCPCSPLAKWLNAVRVLAPLLLLAVMLELPIMAPLTAVPRIEPPYQGAPKAYITNSNADSVSVVDTSTFQVLSTIPVGTLPRSVALAPDGRYAYVVNHGGGGSLNVIDTELDSVVSSIPIGALPYALAITKDGLTAYASSSNKILRIDLVTQAVSTFVSFPQGVGATAFVLSPDQSRLYASCGSSGYVGIVNTSTGVVILRMAHAHAWNIAINPNGTRVYILSSSYLDILDTTTNTVSPTPIQFNTPLGMAINSSGTLGYITDIKFAPSHTLQPSHKHKAGTHLRRERTAGYQHHA